MKKSIFRFLAILVVGIIISIILELILLDFDPSAPSKNRNMDIIGSIVITFLIWIGNLKIDNYLNVFFPWEINHKKRIIIQLLISLTYSSTIIFLSMLALNEFVCEIPLRKQGIILKTSLIIGLLVTLIILSIEIGAQFFKDWKKTLVEVENYKMENIQSQLQNLKNQLNPHFLFNNLSVLTSLVYQDQDKAAEFIKQLSNVYRYLLENKNHELISVQEEMTFMESYFFLLKIRFGNNINFIVNISESDFQFKIPPLSIQTLVENGIKHNEISSANPLTITIDIENRYLKVCNPIQLRTDVGESTKIGLQNIKDRYAFLTNKEVIITNNENSFCVSLPLLEIK